MAASKKQYLIRGVLLCLILAVSVLFWLNVRRSQPAHIWRQAQQAHAEGNYSQASIHLRRLLEEEPDHVDAHLLLADVLVQGDGRSTDVPLSTRRAALGLIVRAAELAPDNPEVQQSLLQALLRDGGDDLDQTFQVATQIASRDPQDAAANSVLARRALQSRNEKKALEHVERVLKQEQPNTLKSLLLAARITHALKETARRNEYLDRAFAMSARLSSEDLVRMSKSERQDLNWLISVGGDSSPTYEVALYRLAIMVDLLDRQVAASNAESSPEVNRLIEAAAKAYGAMLPRLTAPEEDEAVKARRQEISERIERICLQAIQANSARPGVYWAMARSKFAAGQNDLGFQLIDRGIEVAAATPDAAAEDVLWLHHLAAIERMWAGQLELTKPHTEALIQGSDRQRQGWGHLIAGRLAMVEARHDDARRHIDQAHQILGDKYIVNAAQAEIYLRQGRHEEALPYLNRMQAQRNEARAEMPNEVQGSSLTSAPAIHLSQAWALISLGRWDEAESHLTACEADPALAPRAAELRVRQAWSTGQRADALQQLEQARQKFPDDLGLVMTQNTVLRGLNQVDEANRQLSDFVAEHPSNLEALYHLVNLQLRDGRREEVESLLREQRAKSADGPLAQLIQAQLHLVDKQWDLALALATVIGETPGGQTISTAIRTLVALQTNKLDEAAQLFAEMNAEGHAGSGFGFVKSFAEIAAGDDAQVVVELGNLLKVGGLREYAQQLIDGALAQLAREQGTPAAEAALNSLLDKNPIDPYLLTLRWNQAVQARNFELAHATLDRLESLQPHTHRSIASRRSQTFLAEGRADEALLAVERILRAGQLAEARREDIVILLQGAEASVAAKQYQKAIDYGTTALRLDERCWRAYLTLAAAQYRLGKFDEAFDSLRTFIREQPDHPSGYHMLASLLANHPDRKIDEALAVLADGRKRLPIEPKLTLLQIGLLLGTDRRDEAEQVSREYAALNPPSGVSLALAQVFLQASSPELAAEWVNRAKSSGADAASCEWLLGDIRMTQGFKEQDRNLLAQAVTHFENVIALEPKNLASANNLAQLLSTTFGQPEKGLTVLDAATEGIPRDELRVEVVDTYVRALRLAERMDEARQMVDQALLRNPDQALLLLQKGLILQHDGNVDAARAVLQKALDLGLPELERPEAEQALSSLK